MQLSNTLLIIIGASILVVSLGVGFIIGHFTVGSNSKNDDIVKYYESLIEDVGPNGLDEIIKLVKADSLRKNLLEMTKDPHQAGTIYDKISADYVKNAFESYGLDVVELFDYDVLLDYPDNVEYNNLEIKTSTDVVEKLYEIKEDTFNIPSLNCITKPFLAYALQGQATSDELYYVNYCLEQDFEDLKKIGINVTNAIVICKYGRVFRGNKVGMAQNYGAKAVILFDDPINSVPAGQNDYIFPEGEFLPPEGTQRGSIILSLNGDPLTPFYPSTEYAYRKDMTNLDVLPKIQAQVIGYQIAYDLFKLIENNNNPVVSNDWKGAMNVTYSYGGKLSNQRKLSVNIFNQRDVRKAYNAMGLIKGSVEEDRYIIIGNHRDAWNLGALDPTAGTAVMLELSRVLMTMKKNGSWRPKRSVLFMSWGAEEYGLIGSVEWVEEYQKKLSANGVIYLNLDTAVTGNYSFKSSGSPLIKDFLFNVAKTIKHTTGETVYDRWLKNDLETSSNLPRVSPYLGAGSDHMSFSQRVGLPCTDHSMIRDKDNPRYKNVGTSGYPAYHTSYETFDLVEKFVDPKFEAFRTLAVVISEAVRQLTEKLILPFNCVSYAESLENEFKNFETTYKSDFESYNMDMNLLRSAISNFTATANDFHKRLNAIDTSKYHLVRMYNEQLRGLEKAFLNSIDPERKGFNHMIFAPSVINSYGSDVFPAITDAIYLYKKNLNSNKLLEDVKLQYSILLHSIQSASSVLKESYNFKRFVS